MIASSPELEAAERKSRTRNANCFDFLRLFAAVSVLVSHSAEHLKISFLWFRSRDQTWFYDGVPLFFILSGYLVFRSFEKCHERRLPVWHFFLNRYLRIAPAIYAYAF